MSATPGEAPFGGFTFGGDDDERFGPSSMTVATIQSGRLDIAVEESTSSTTIGVS